MEVEESDLLRWWHVYEGDSLGWRHRNSSNALLCDSIILSTADIGRGDVAGKEETQYLYSRSEGFDGRSRDHAKIDFGQEVEVIDLTME